MAILTHSELARASCINAEAGAQRVTRLLRRSRRLQVLEIPPPGAYDPSTCGEGLARKINSAWLGLATTSSFDYLLGKYFEIAACRTTVVGNMNEQGRAIFGADYVHIDRGMSDRRILATIEAALADRRPLQAMADRMSGVMHDGYTLAHLERKLYGLAAAIHQGRSRGDSSG